MNKIKFTFLSFLVPLLLYSQYDYEVTTLIPQGSNMVDDGLAIDENGVVYGSYWGIWQGTPGTHILRYYPNGTIDTLAQGLFRPNGMDYANGNLYVASGSQNRIVKINTTTGNVQTFANIQNPSSVAVVPGTDSLVSVSYLQEKLFGISPSGNVTELSNSNLLNGPVGITYDADGVLHVSNFNDGKILQYNGDGTFQTIADIGGGTGFITYSDGAILATNHVLKNVWKIPQNGIGIHIISGSGTPQIIDGVNLNASFSSPNGIIATTNSDTIYVSEFMGKALRRIIRTQGNLNIENPKRPNEIKIYPNPATHSIYLKLENLNGNHRADVFDLNGKLIKTFQISDTTEKLDISTLEKGVYLLKVYQGNDNYQSEKFIVN